MKLYLAFAFALGLSIVTININAQALSQTIRGTVFDKVLQKPIPGATIRIQNLNLGDQTDEQGNFILPKVPVGVHALIITAMGYKEVALNNLTLNSRKELVLNVAMEEKILEGKEVVIKTNRKKNIPINDMSLISARSFSVEET